MIKRFSVIFALVGGLCGTACADTFLASIIKVDGNTVTYKKATYHAGNSGGKQYSFGEPITAEVRKDVTITRGHFLPTDGETTTRGRMTGKSVAFKGGLEHEFFKKINAGKTVRPGLLTIADEGADKGKITAINMWSSASPK